MTSIPRDTSPNSRNKIGDSDKFNPSNYTEVAAIKCPIKVAKSLTAYTRSVTGFHFISSGRSRRRKRRERGPFRFGSEIRPTLAEVRGRNGDWLRLTFSDCHRIIAMEAQVDEKMCGKLRLACGLYNYKLRDVFTWDLLKTLVMGQVLSLMICGTAVSCQYLADAGAETPMLQSFLNYALLLLAYTTVLCTHKGERNFLQVLKTKWWKYLLMGVADVEANYTVVKAYRYTTLTSIQLLDCFVVPALMLMSWFLLKTRYRPLHYIAVTVCLLGVGAMVGADILAGREQGSASDVVLGDGLVLISAVLYAVSNLCQEFTVKNRTRVEFLGMMGFFGTIVSGIQLAALEISAVKEIKWNFHIAMLFAMYVLCMFALYSFMPVVVKRTSATAVNLSLLTADLFSLFCGLFLFHYTFSPLYIMAFILIMVGFVTFNALPTHSAQPEPDSGDPSDQEALCASDRLLPADRNGQNNVTVVSAL